MTLKEILSSNLEPHPAKATFQRHGVQFGAVAKHLSINYAYLSDILSGRRRPSAGLNSRIKGLARELDRETAA